VKVCLIDYNFFVSNNEIPEEFLEKFFEGKFPDSIERMELYGRKDEPMFSFESGLYQNGVSVLLPHTTADFLDIKLEFQGFCIVTLIRKNGLLVNGRPNIVTNFKDKHMVFYNHAAVQEFIENPTFFLEEINKYVHQHPYLINLLNMTEELPMANLSTLFRNYWITFRLNNFYKIINIILNTLFKFFNFPYV
jgi:hypothetical protein